MDERTLQVFSMSFFNDVALAPSDPILGLNAAFYADERQNKINLTAGVYKSDDLKTPLMKCVKDYEKKFAEEGGSKEYLPIEGESHYLQEVGKLVFGKSHWQENSPSISCFQTIGGTGALRIAGEFLLKEIRSSLYLSDPSWPNHKGVFSQVGLDIQEYPYYDRQSNSLQFEAMKAKLALAQPGSVVLFHACCHNPSGLDPSLEEWQELATICKERNLLPFFDAAYLGFDKTVEEDARAIRIFAEKGMEMMVAVSFSKNFSLYGERVGALYVISKIPEIAKRVTSQIKILIRRNYSNPPIHGAKLVGGILSQEGYRKGWEAELAEMRDRVFHLKKAFSERLVAKVKSKDYHYLAKTKGMFCFCGLDQPVVERLIKEKGIYMTYDGRINVAGLTMSSIDYVADAIANLLG